MTKDEIDNDLAIAATLALKASTPDRRLAGAEWLHQLTGQLLQAIRDEQAQPEQSEQASTIPTLPNGIPQPPDGFIFAGMEELRHPANNDTPDILWYNFFKWSDCENHGWTGQGFGPWAIRAGTELARLNGLEPEQAEPESASTAQESPGEGWRYLKEGDIIQQGDEWREGGKYYAVNVSIGRTVIKTEERHFRRRIAPAESVRYFKSEMFLRKIVNGVVYFKGFEPGGWTQSENTAEEIIESNLEITQEEAKQIGGEL